MAGRILVVSRAFGPATHLERVLVTAGFEVAIATKEDDCILACRHGGYDAVLLDARSPEIAAFDLCACLKGEAAVAPVIVIGDADRPGDRLSAIDAGADEVLSWPAGETEIIARVSSVVQLKSVLDAERRLRILRGLTPTDSLGGQKEAVRMLVLDPDGTTRARLVSLFGCECQVAPETQPAQALLRAAEGAYDIALVALDWPVVDGRRLCAQLRQVDATGRLRVLAMMGEAHAESGRFVRVGGIEDILVRPIDRTEALARVRIAARKIRLAAALRTHEALGFGAGPSARPARWYPPQRSAA
jgi:two-component system cell cycle response regulator